MALKSKRLSGLSSTIAIFLMRPTHSDTSEDGGYPYKSCFEVVQWPDNSRTLFCHRQPFNGFSQCLHRHNRGDAQKSTSANEQPADRLKVAFLQTYSHRFKPFWRMFEEESEHTLGQLYTTQPLETYKDRLIKVSLCNHRPSPPHTSHCLLSHPEGQSVC